ncbi:MAG: bifunctional biotin--[acetyl-CoA-carboxylase] ligase/biotin operon repressor BirA [Lysobacter sp.]|nr:MAG: bifunctional biotin--[acetyl-CoA-carboxylase] ligase/biotin operon repressor BirA [Lysobacter sp.]
MDDRALLQRLIEGPASGDLLARAAGQTRAAVWKRIEALRQAGVPIEAVAGRGYRLGAPLDLLDEAAIRAVLPVPMTSRLGMLEVAWSVDSTNTRLLEAPVPADGAHVLLAERQLRGRGRRGRPWQSPLGANLYLSVSRAFDGGLARLGGLSLVAGLAVAEALHSLGFTVAGLKWPNDLVVDDGAVLRKLGGLLVEGSGEAAGPVRAVIGIGLNVCMPDTAAASIDQPWIDLATLAPPPSRNVLAGTVLARLLPMLDAFDRDGLAPFLPRWAAFDRLQGRDIDLHLADGIHAAHAVGLAADGALRVRMADGSERSLHAGEVSVRRADA